jgi:hypothetical protein
MGFSANLHIKSNVQGHFTAAFGHALNLSGLSLLTRATYPEPIFQPNM